MTDYLNTIKKIGFFVIKMSSWQVSPYEFCQFLEMLFYRTPVTDYLSTIKIMTCDWLSQYNKENWFLRYKNVILSSKAKSATVEKAKESLSEKCPNTELFLVRIFLYSTKYGDLLGKSWTTFFRLHILSFRFRESPEAH